jgi:hypothetical protein
VDSDVRRRGGRCWVWEVEETNMLTIDAVIVLKTPYEERALKENVIEDVPS